MSLPRRARALLSLLLLPLAAAGACTTSIDEGLTGTTSGPGGAGGGAGCTPGTLVDCYTGPPGTVDVGVCHGGAKKCNDDGMTFGECQWEVIPAAEDCKTPEDEDCDGKTPSCPGGVDWAESFGGGGVEYAQAVAVDKDGNIVIIGGFDGTFQIGATTLIPVGLDDMFVAKFDPSGKAIWAKAFGSLGKDYALGLALDAQGNIVVTGISAGDIDFGDGTVAGFGQEDMFLLKLDPSGALLWRKVFGSPLIDAGYGVAVAPNGDIVTTGSFSGTVDFGTGGLTSAGKTDIVIARYAPDGQPIWVKQFGGQYNDFGYSVAVTQAGDALVAGGFYGPVDFGTGPFTTAGYYDGFLAKFDVTGQAIWANQLPGGAMMGSFPAIAQVAVGDFGSTVIAGYFFGQIDLGGGPLVSAGGSDGFLARYDSSGNHVFSKRFGGTYTYPNQPTYVTDGVLGLAMNNAGDKGDAIITGTYIDAIDFGGGPLKDSPYGDAFIAALTSNGGHVFSESFGTDASYAIGSGVAMTPTGKIIVAGYFVGTIDFGMGPLNTQTGQDSDLFLVQLSP